MSYKNKRFWLSISFYALAGETLYQIYILFQNIFIEPNLILGFIRILYIFLANGVLWWMYILLRRLNVDELIDSLPPLSEEEIRKIHRKTRRKLARLFKRINTKKE